MHETIREPRNIDARAPPRAPLLPTASVLSLTVTHASQCHTLPQRVSMALVPPMAHTDTTRPSQSSISSVHTLHHDVCALPRTCSRCSRDPARRYEWRTTSHERERRRVISGGENNECPHPIKDFRSGAEATPATSSFSRATGGSDGHLSDPKWRYGGLLARLALPTHCPRCLFNDFRKKKRSKS